MPPLYDKSKFSPLTGSNADSNVSFDLASSLGIFFHASATGHYVSTLD